MARLKDLYKSKITAELNSEFGYNNLNAIPKIEKVVVSMGVGRAIQDKRIIDIDEEKLMQDVRRIAIELWDKVSETDWANRTIYEIGPRSITLDEES